MRQGGVSEDGRGTATVLFTDIVGSTELRVAAGDLVADELFVRFERLLGEIVAAHDGRVIKGLGDGIMATFNRSADGVLAAVAMQRATHREGRRAVEERRVQIRVGLSAGDVTWKDGDCHGTPVVTSSRLCDAADAGQILCDDLVRGLGRGNADLTFRIVGELDLKGLPEPVLAFSVPWEAADAEGAQLPGPLRALEDELPFAGRDEERLRLTDVWKQAQVEGTSVALLSGEPGVGKTRLAAELARAAHRDGALVVLGRCDEHVGGRTRPVDRGAPVPGRGRRRPDARRARGPFAAASWHVSSPRSRPGSPMRPHRRRPTSRPNDSCSSTRWSISSPPRPRCGRCCSCSTTPTGRMPRASICCATSSRTSRPEPPSSLPSPIETPTSTAATRWPPRWPTCAGPLGVVRVDLHGLDEEGMRALLAAAGGHDLDDNGVLFARRLVEETEGNPFFVREVLRHLIETGTLVQRDGLWVGTVPAGEAGLPEGVRDVVGRRLSRLSEDANAMLRVASVIGREFDADVVAAVVGCSEDEAVDRLDEALAARLVDEVEGRFGRMTFAHALVRSTLLDELSTNRRIRLHRQIADALVERPGTTNAELAHHYCEAATAGVADQAVQYSRAAGAEARDRLAVDDAVAIYERALEAIDGMVAEPSPLRAWVLGDLALAIGARGDMDAGAPGWRSKSPTWRARSTTRCCWRRRARPTRAPSACGRNRATRWRSSSSARRSRASTPTTWSPGRGPAPLSRSGSCWLPATPACARPTPPSRWRGSPATRRHSAPHWARARGRCGDGCRSQTGWSRSRSTPRQAAASRSGPSRPAPCTSWAPRCSTPATSTAPMRRSPRAALVSRVSPSTAGRP